MMEVESFDEAEFLERVDFVESLPDRILIYHFKDGTANQWPK